MQALLTKLTDIGGMALSNYADWPSIDHQRYALTAMLSAEMFPDFDGAVWAKLSIMGVPGQSGFYRMAHLPMTPDNPAGFRLNCSLKWLEIAKSYARMRVEEEDARKRSADAED